MPRVEIPDEFLCCLTLELFVEPVVAADGNTYERSEILKWFKRKQTTSPRTDLPLDDFSLRPNIQLKDAVERFKKCLLSEEAFAAAIKKGDLKTLEARDFLDPRTFSPVRLAVESNQLLVLKYMVGQMHTELVKNNDLLFYARSRPMVQYLVEECKMALEITNKEEQTALEYFCNDRLAIPEEELLAIVAELLRHGADAKPKHKTGGSVFSLLGLPLALVKLLVSAGAAPPELISHVDEFGETFMHAFWSSSEKCAERFPYILSLAGDIPQQIALVSRITKTGCSVVHRCVANPKILKFIFSAPYSLHANVTNKWGSTPIHEWVGYDIPDESLPSLSLLLNEGKCDIDAKRKNNGKTALHLAVSYGRLECVHLLLAAGANTKIVDNEGKCAFDYCTNEKWMRLYRNALSNTTSEFFARYGFVPPVGDWKSSAWQPARSALAAFASAVPAGAAHSASAASAAAGSSVTGHSASAASAPALLAAPSLTVSALSKKRNAEVDPLETGDENESDSKRPTKRANISTENGGSAAATASAVAPSQDKKGEGIITIKVRSQEGNEVDFKLKKTSQFRKLIVAYCRVIGVDVDAVSFMFNGNRIRRDQTPEELEMSDEDEVEAMKTHKFETSTRRQLKRDTNQQKGYERISPFILLEMEKSSSDSKPQRGTMSLPSFGMSERLQMLHHDVSPENSAGREDPPTDIVPIFRKFLKHFAPPTAQTADDVDWFALLTNADHIRGWQDRLVKLRLSWRIRVAHLKALKQSLQALYSGEKSQMKMTAAQKKQYVAACAVYEAAIQNRARSANGKAGQSERTDASSAAAASDSSTIASEDDVDVPNIGLMFGISHAKASAETTDLSGHVPVAAAATYGRPAKRTRVGGMFTAAMDELIIAATTIVSSQRGGTPWKALKEKNAELFIDVDNIQIRERSRILARRGERAAAAEAEAAAAESGAGAAESEAGAEEAEAPASASSEAGSAAAAEVVEEAHGSESGAADSGNPEISIGDMGAAAAEVEDEAELMAMARRRRSKRSRREATPATQLTTGNMMNVDEKQRAAHSASAAAVVDMKVPAAAFAGLAASASASYAASGAAAAAAFASTSASAATPILVPSKPFTDWHLVTSVGEIVEAALCRMRSAEVILVPLDDLYCCGDARVVRMAVAAVMKK